MGERDAGPASEAETGALIGATLGGFRLTSQLGIGGMAEVYRGFDPRLERYVAIKVLPGHLAQNAQYVARFRSEAQRVAALDHPNIVPVYHYGEERGLLYLVMPLLKESLRDRMRREGTLNPVEAVFLAVEVAVALDVAHRQGLVHRDVKPENILLNDEGRPLLTDFGIAREVEALRDPTTVRTLAATGLPVGTPEYMAPEQLRGAVADQRVDVYGLGTVLYEMLTGRTPHEGGTPYEVVARVLTERPLPPTSYNPTIWPELTAVVLGAVEPDPDRRYSSMSILEEALRRAILAKGTSTDVSLGAHTTIPLGSSAALRLTPSAADMPGHRDLLPEGHAGDGSARARRDLWARSGVIATTWGDVTWGGGLKSRSRHTRVLTALAVVIVLALGSSGVLYAFNASGSSTTGHISTPVPDLSNTPVILPTASPHPTLVPTPTHTLAPDPTDTPEPTATPLLTPTIIVSSSPLQFQPYPSTGSPKNCVAQQQLTNISDVDAQWSWTNAPSAGGWSYNLTGFDKPTSGWPATFTKTTAPHSTDYVFVKTGYDMGCNSKATITATISVTTGTGTQFTVVY